MEELSERWDLESLFAGGSGSSQLAQWITGLEADVERCRAAVEALAAVPDDQWETVILAYQEAATRLSEAYSFVGCLEAQDTEDDQASRLDADLATMWASFSTVTVALAARFRVVEDAVWKSFLKRSVLAPIAYGLDQMRLLAGRKMDPKREILVEELAADGYHGWDRLYTKLAGSLRATVTADGGVQEVSLGQLANRMEDRDRAVRKDAFTRLEGAWQPVAELAAITLNNLAGFRLALYRSRGWRSILEEPLQLNRLQAIGYRACLATAPAVRR